MVTYYYSDDGKLMAAIEWTWCSMGNSYIVRLYRQGNIPGMHDHQQPWNILATRIFGNGVSAEDWLLDKLECPLFTVLES